MARKGKSLAIGDMEAMFDQIFGTVTDNEQSDFEQSNNERLESERPKDERLNIEQPVSERPISIQSENKRPTIIRLIPERSESEQPITIDGCFYKTDNEIDDLLMPLLSPVEQSIYRFLYRHSYGQKEPSCLCSISYDDLSKYTGVKSRTSVQKYIEALIEFGCISIYKEKEPRKPRVYKIHLPCEIERIKDKSKRPFLKRSISERLDFEQLNSERPENESLYVQNLDNQSPKSERSKSEQLEKKAGSSWGNGEEKNIEKSHKDKDIFKDNNIVVLKSLFQKEPWDKITNQGLITISRYDIEKVKKHMAWVDKQPKCSNPIGMLIVSLEQNWDVEKKSKLSEEEKEAIDAIQRAQEAQEATKEKIRIYKTTLTEEEAQRLKTEATEALKNDLAYITAKSELIRNLLLNGKIDELILQRLQ